MFIFILTLIYANLMDIGEVDAEYLKQKDGE